MGESLIHLDSNFSSDAKHRQTACEPDSFPSLQPNPYDTAYKREEILDWLGKNVPPKRLQHILSVESLAIALAHHHQLDEQRAAQAGLMHDLAKCFKPQRLLQLAIAEGVELDSVFEANPHLLHADVGAIVAQQQFGVHDAAVLDAIRYHTLGAPGMSPLSCVVFLADSLEPGRGDTPALQALRQVMWHNLPQAVWLTSDYTLNYLITSRALIHPRAVLTRNWAMRACQTHPTDS